MPNADGVSTYQENIDASWLTAYQLISIKINFTKQWGYCRISPNFLGGKIVCLEQCSMILYYRCDFHLLPPDSILNTGDQVFHSLRDKFSPYEWINRSKNAYSPNTDANIFQVGLESKNYHEKLKLFCLYNIWKTRTDSVFNQSVHLRLWNWQNRITLWSILWCTAKPRKEEAVRVNTHIFVK